MQKETVKNFDLTGQNGLFSHSPDSSFTHVNTYKITPPKQNGALKGGNGVVTGEFLPLNVIAADNFLKQINERMIRCRGRIKVFRSYRDNPSDLSKAREYYLTHADVIVPPDYEIESRRLIKAGHTPLTKEEYKKNRALEIFGRDVTVAKRFATEDVRITRDHLDLPSLNSLDDLIHDEQGHLLDLGIEKYLFVNSNKSSF